MVFQCAGSSLVDYGKITCKIVLKFPLAPYIVDFPYKESWDKLTQGKRIINHVK